ncbi:MAG: molybdopterin-containing oxidoreductase family protein [Planctomycetota bacterium]|jgi:anaerobic selenocysteine-containing dehydrogenase
MSKLHRRDFLVATGGLIAGGVTGCGLEFGPPAVRRVQGGPLPALPDTVNTICLQCPAGCGIEVTRVDGVPVQIKPNKDYPTNGDPAWNASHATSPKRGGLCPKGVAGLQVLYDPDRIKGPLRRTGAPGSDRWEAISWDEAIGAVAGELKRLRGEDAPHSVAFMGGRYQGSMEPLVRRFLHAYGSPNDLGSGSVGSDGTKVALEMTQGVYDYPGFDWEQTNYVISFGASWLEAYRPTAYLLRAISHLRRGRPGRRAKLVHVDTRYSVTSAKADEWVPIRTGTDAALALGMAHWIVANERWNKEYVAAHTFGFEDWEDEEGKHPGFRRFVLENYAPEEVEKITGVEASRVVRLAEEFVEGQPGFAVGERGTSMQSNGLYTRMAVHALNALVGSINRPGGVLVQQEAPLRPFPATPQDDVARRGMEQPRLDGAGTRRFPLAKEVSQAVADAVLSGRPYPVQALFLYYTNPLFSRTNARDFLRAFDRIPLIVSFSPFMDDSTRHAHYVLPDHTYLERWQEVPILPSVGYPVVGIRRPVVDAPLHDTKHTGDALLEIGRAIGGTVAEALPWKDYRALMTWRLGGLHGVEGGSASASSEKSLVRKIEKAGGWWGDPEKRFLTEDQVFRTPSKRFEFFSTRLRAKLRAVLGPDEAPDDLLAELGVAARGDLAYLPHFEPVRLHGDEAEYPFLLNTYKTMARAEGRGANQPWLQEIGGFYLHQPWSTWLEINPATARELGIADGELVWVESQQGRLGRPVPARHYPGARPDVVNMPFDQGHRGYGRWAEQIGANPNDILVPDEDRLSGMVAYFGTRVRIRRV